uniref:Ribosomal protein L32 n=1 Tax=Amorphochlora amoebiformis TaxID=1561963 RepID=A0A0H5BHV5_9EUKA|nr:ribosomal protein L32 [Amorphochlora amoebiformis]
MSRRFPRYNTKSVARIKSSWRKPIGIDSNIRKKIKGSQKMPSIGYRTDKSLRNYGSNYFKDKNGKFNITINTISDINLFSGLKNNFEFYLSKKFFYQTFYQSFFILVLSCLDLTIKL